jgi:hypothetical protein
MLRIGGAELHQYLHRCSFTQLESFDPVRAPMHSGDVPPQREIGRNLWSSPSTASAAPRCGTSERPAAEVIDLFTVLNRRGITVILVTHEADIATFARGIVRSGVAVGADIRRALVRWCANSPLPFVRIKLGPRLARAEARQTQILARV